MADGAPWLRDYLRAAPELLNVSFLQVASGSASLLGVQRGRGHFFAPVKALVALVPWSDVHFVWLEQFKANPSAVLADVATFLGIQDHGYNFSRHRKFRARMRSGQEPPPAAKESLDAYYEQSRQELEDIIKTVGAVEDPEVVAGKLHKLAKLGAEMRFEPT